MERLLTYRDLNVLMITLQADIITLGKLRNQCLDSSAELLSTIGRIHQLNNIRDSIVDLLLAGRSDESTVYLIQMQNKRKEEEKTVDGKKEEAICNES